MDEEQRRVAGAFQQMMTAQIAGERELLEQLVSEHEGDEAALLTICLDFIGRLAVGTAENPRVDSSSFVLYLTDVAAGLVESLANFVQRRPIEVLQGMWLAQEGGDPQL